MTNANPNFIINEMRNAILAKARAIPLADAKVQLSNRENRENKESNSPIEMRQPQDTPKAAVGDPDANPDANRNDIFSIFDRTGF